MTAFYAAIRAWPPLPKTGQLPRLINMLAQYATGQLAFCRVNATFCGP